jgi:KDO2-lipid IV(A) lauroyltransferase
MAKSRNKLLDYLVYLAGRTAATAIEAGAHNERLLYRLAAGGAKVFTLLFRRHRRIAEGHLRLSFPHWSDRRIRRVAGQSLRSMFMLGVDTIILPRMITPYNWVKHVRLGDLRQTLIELIERNTGVILLTGHYGNWELAGYTLAALGFESVAIARHLDNEYLNRYLLGVRESAGQTIVSKKGAAKVVEGVLDNKGLLGFIADQDAGRRGLYVDFFGRPASTYKSIALLAIRHQTPIVVGYARRTSDAFDFEIGVERIIRPAEWAEQDDPVRWITQQYTAALERLVRRDPGQYLWFHRRWKHRPDGTKAPGLGVA